MADAAERPFSGRLRQEAERSLLPSLLSAQPAIAIFLSAARIMQCALFLFTLSAFLISSWNEAANLVQCRMIRMLSPLLKDRSNLERQSSLGILSSQRQSWTNPEQWRVEAGSRQVRPRQRGRSWTFVAAAECHLGHVQSVHTRD